MFRIIFLIAIVFCFVFMFKKRSQVLAGQISQDPLTGNEKLVTWLVCLLNPIWGGAILYYGWKGRLPVKAKSANQISLWAFFLELVVGIALIVLLNGVK